MLIWTNSSGSMSIDLDSVHGMFKSAKDGKTSYRYMSYGYVVVVSQETYNAMYDAWQERSRGKESNRLRSNAGH